MKTGQQQLSFLTVLLISFGLGTAFGAYCGIPFSAALPYFIVLLLFAGTAAGFLVLRKSPVTWTAFVGLFFILGMFRFSAAYELPAADISNVAGRDVRVTGIVSDAPRVIADADGTRRIRYTAEAKTVSEGGDERSVRGRFFIYTRVQPPEEPPDAEIGDRITAAGKLRRPHGYQNPGQIDTAFLLRTQGITAALHASQGGVSAEEAEHVSLVQKFMRLSADIRTHYMDRMTEVMPRADAAAIFAMLFGGYEGIRPELLEAFTTTGIVHILSVSGSHISLIAAVTAWLTVLLRFPKWLRALSVISVIVTYVVLAGLVPPAVRSGIMGGTAFLGLVLGRERDAQRILIITGFLMLMVSPLLLFHISFQLSFLATAGLLFLAPVLRRRMERLPALAAGSLSITISAQLATVPVLAWYFNQVSLSSLLSNLVVVPLVEIIIVFGLFGGIAALVLPVLGRLVFGFDSLLLGITFELTRLMAALPAAKIWLPSGGIGWGIAYYALLAVLFAPKETRRMIVSQVLRRGKAVGAACVVLLAVFVFRCAAQQSEMSVHFIDVGQGDCALVITPHGHAMLFDTGGTRDGAFDIGARVDVPYLLHCGVREIDYIFLSHAHEDHAAGAGAILARMPVKHVFIADEGTAAYARSMRMSDGDPLLLKFSKAEAGQVISLDGVTVDTVYAPPYDPADSATGNEVSNVYRVCYGEASFLFTGDLVKEHEEKMLALRPDVQSTVVEVPHHGSHTSSSEAFVAASHPQYAVYSVGMDNSFGHPRPEIVERYERMGAKTLRTDRDGAVIFRTDGKRLTVETYAEGGILHEHIARARSFVYNTHGERRDGTRIL